MSKEVSKNTGKTPSPSQMKRADKKGVALRLYFQGQSVGDIAAAVKAETGQSVAVGVVQNWIAEHLNILKETRSDVVENFKFVELEKINRLEIAYWIAWEKSSSVQVTIREVFKPAAKVPGKRNRSKNIAGELESTIKETKTLTGEARYLQGVQWCVEQRIKLLGVESAKKNEVGTQGEGEGADAIKEAAAEMGTGTTRRIVFRGPRTGM